MRDTSEKQARLAVIGADPKAAALAARVAAISEWQARGTIVDEFDPRTLRPAPELHIFERRNRVGAHWDGRGMDGYTDGLQEVCTDPDRDLVYWPQATRTSVQADVANGSRAAIIGAGGAAAAVCLDLLSAVATAANPGTVVLIAPHCSAASAVYPRREWLRDRVVDVAFVEPAAPRSSQTGFGSPGIGRGVRPRPRWHRGARPHARIPVGRALAALDGSHNGRGSSIELWCSTLDERLSIVEADWVIDATGFDPLWFISLLDEPAVRPMAPPRLQRLLGRFGPNVLSEKLDEHLRLHVEVELFEAGGGTPDAPLLPIEPGLHVPFLAGGSRPPGYASLLQLGGLADKILFPYLH